MCSAPIPGVVYLDTSVGVAAIVHGRHHSGPSVAFGDDLAAVGSLVAVSHTLRLEPPPALLKRATRRESLPAALREACRLDNRGADPSVRERSLHFGVREVADRTARFRQAIEAPFDTVTGDSVST